MIREVGGRGAGPDGVAGVDGDKEVGQRGEGICGGGHEVRVQRPAGTVVWGVELWGEAEEVPGELERCNAG